MTGSLNLSSMGRQPQSTKKSSPQYRFPGGPARAKLASGRTSAGPGSYALRSSMGEQVLSVKPSSPAGKFGRSKRAALSSSDIDVGPGQYRTKPSHVERADPSWSFSRSKRPSPAGTRGSGSMAKQGTGFGRQTPSRCRTAPSVSMSGRQNFGAIRNLTAGPGPAAFLLSSTMGRQSLSSMPSSGVAAFSMSRREEMASKGKNPGPGQYGTSSTMGVQPISTRASSPLYTCRSREKFMSLYDVTGTSSMPGPNTYAPEKHSLPRSKTQPKYSMGKRYRQKLERSQTPGPGSYRTRGSMGAQEISTKVTEQSYRFSKGRGAKKDGKAVTDSPGPGKYKLRGTLQTQSESRTKTQPAYSFGKAKRPSPTGRRAQDTSLVVLPDSFGRQVLSRTRSSPSATMSGRTAFGNPFGQSLDD